ncbi:high affinity immunoglobulin alpha and immunoglobulin mu Fc receptor isoform X1 [Mus musculus]|uniref:high affinity immunoglobulin alpha and immunoglobulin mu Fc receptor isoform X1 n=1 Tax=Mus musculus TaxID=10090 RepID=UPI0003D7082F|nr:high affinity immunoglobulin alpha and immunoglobulin mu Fc receptor isoform X1 [Mus musculus]XP_017177411.1 high affinity immunoglobulin alpha and immunoglobulin mu Fc receptor isoform X1 [Mus musculus]XP_017177412.1 high affinity immunoglobulin alpha and immunoglobulin mu Fc receptor isoform X1 [Mus musculus]XP_017177413.1 high affinity immunoglobulin alpha and immunoglobulin mu Fc receptor isoform X1 [Mus musculus]|eukprot:XP_017177410.1 PREDICTED: high affinity immunoglobulin alpha and immunoglobulin mu Fc receptor isoform X1 [Mus musculus]
MSKSSWQHLTCQDTQFPGPAFRVELPSYWSKLRMHSQSAEPWTPDHSLQLLTSLPLASCLWLQVPSLRTRWEILLLTLCLLHGSSMTPPHRRSHSRWLQAGSPQFRTHLYNVEAHTAPTPLCCWKNSLSGTNALRGPRLVTGNTGGAVTIHCHYAPSSVNRHQRKYWCRLGSPLWICHTVVSTNQYTHPDYRGRAALTDIPQSGLFVVRLLRLSLGDVGLYRCGIGDRNDMLFFSVNLTVSAGPSNTTYAAAPASGEPTTASPGAASSAGNGWTSGITQILEGSGSEWDRTVPTTGTSKTTSSANGRQTLRTARTMVPGTGSREEGSIRAAVPTPEGPSPKSRSMSSTTQGVWLWSTRNSVTPSVTTSEGRRQGTTPETDGPRDETDVRVSPEAPRKTTGTTRPSALISEHVTWETLQDKTEVSKQQMLHSLEELSPAPSAQTLNATCLEVASEEGRSIDGSLENTTEESSPPTPSQLSVAGPVWVSVKGPSMKSALMEGESHTRILTPVSTVLALLLIAALILLKRSLGRQRTSQKKERVPRITLIQMTHFLPDKLPDEGKNFQQSNLLPPQASLTVLENDPRP